MRPLSLRPTIATALAMALISGFGPVRRHVHLQDLVAGHIVGCAQHDIQLGRCPLVVAILSHGERAREECLMDCSTPATQPHLERQARVRVAVRKQRVAVRAVPVLHTPKQLKHIRSRHPRFV